MKKIKLGDLLLFKTHPYVHNIDPIKISANALFISPIINVIEIAYRDYTKTDITKIRGVFYNSNINKFEKLWFNVDELVLFKGSDDCMQDEFALFSKYTLRSTVDELKKLKSIYQVDNGSSKSSSSSTLNHLPPVFLILEQKEIEIEGNKKLKDFSDEGFKVKWFNPKTNLFSEDILPKSILAKVSDNEDEKAIIEAIDNKYIYEYELPKIIVDKSKNLKIENSIFRIVDVRYNHLSIIIVIFDILLNKEIELLIEEARPIISKPSKLFSDYFFNKHPKLVQNKFIYPYEFDFKVNHLYNITYINSFGEKKVRCIVVYKILQPDLNEENNNGKIIEAFCLLRNEIRYFWTKRIVQMFESNIKL
ncbi:hypothetical protein QE382_002317 [Sphingobacterium zeae]|uniref:BAH domain-containing protein n=1 Tax=Sphingobacterium zeae TaxID=1776859 RepID=A0ABU0U5W8_9SPHI|nr:hypothetical protein [Sphingobacterium zeae]MDQ1150333.1 hypothetical protein [Sphingobacterium zeae]